MKTSRFDFNWKPLQIQTTISVEGSIPDKQNYNAFTKEYTPDYTLAPITIQPSVSVLDKDGYISSGSVNYALANIRWYEIIGGKRRLIASNDHSYEITTSGEKNGQIKVKKNAQPNIPITLEFYAEYIDVRNNQLYIIRGTHLLSCSNAANDVRVELDAAEQTIYNPLDDPQEQKITATVWVGDCVCSAEKYTLVWEVKDGYTWRTIGDSVKDSDIHITSEGVAVINRDLMGNDIALRCRVKYSATGTPESVELNDAAPYATVVIKRRIPKFEYNITDVPYNIPAGLLEIAPRAVIYGNNSIIENAEKELLPLWYIAKNNPNTSLSYNLVAHGSAPILSPDKMDVTNGGVIGLEVIDRGAVGIAQDSDGKAFVDSDGKLFVFH